MSFDSIVLKIDELIDELQKAKRPGFDMEIGLFTIDLKFKKEELQELYR